jgi:hypothetical protein
MAKRTETAAKKKAIEQYDHKGKQRVNNPPVGLVDVKSAAVSLRNRQPGQGHARHHHP